MKKNLVYALLLVQWIACSKSPSPPPPPPPPAKPTITSFTPSSGEEGTNVTISGENLNVVTGVAFNGTTSIFHLDGNKIQTAVPSGASSGTITVKSPNGDGVSSTSFTVIPKLPAPIIDSTWPVSSPVDKEVEIFGKNLDSVVKITFGGVDADSIYLREDGKIGTTVPKNLTAGDIDLVIVNSRGGTATIPFTILANADYGEPSPEKAASTKTKAKHVSRVTDNWFNAADPGHNYSMHLDSIDAHHGSGTEYINSDSYGLTFTYDLNDMTIEITVDRGVPVIYRGVFVEPDPGTEKIVVYTEDHRQLVFVVTLP